MEIVTTTLTALEVIILVLLEDTLRDSKFEQRFCTHQVIILVLLEDTLRGGNTYCKTLKELS